MLRQIGDTCTVCFQPILEWELRIRIDHHWWMLMRLSPCVSLKPCAVARNLISRALQPPWMAAVAWAAASQPWWIETICCVTWEGNGDCLGRFLHVMREEGKEWPIRWCTFSSFCLVCLFAYFAFASVPWFFFYRYLNIWFVVSIALYSHKIQSRIYAKEQSLAI